MHIVAGAEGGGEVSNSDEQLKMFCYIRHNDYKPLCGGDTSIWHKAFDVTRVTCLACLPAGRSRHFYSTITELTCSGSMTKMTRCSPGCRYG